MAGYFTVDTSFWTDSDVLENFTPEDKYFYLYLLTCPYANISGCYEISLRQIAYDTGYSKETVERLIERFVKVHKVIDFDHDNKELLVCNWGKYHWTKSDKYSKALDKRISAVKTERFRAYLSFAKSEYMKSGDSDTVWIRYTYGMDTSYTYTSTLPSTVNKEDNGGVGEEGKKKPEKKAEKKERDRKSIPPTVEEVRDYCIERKNGIDPEYFCDYYAGRGWKLGKDSMKDWQAAVRTWEKNRKLRGNGNGTGSNRKNGYGQVDGNDQGLKQKYSDLVYFDANDESTWGIFDG